MADRPRKAAGGGVVTAPDPEAHNRQFWDADADAYQDAHGAFIAERPLAWGVFRVPESDLGALGEVAGRDILEFGCGGAQWSIALRELGARPVGLDQSVAQLRHARGLMAGAGVDFPLVLASGTAVPLADESFDVVLADHGAFSFCDPKQAIPEATRVVRRGGVLAFCHATPWRYVTDKNDLATRELHHSYFGLGRYDNDEGTIDWCLPYGGWIAIFRSCGLTIEALHELRPRKGETTTFEDFVDPKWARKWPADQVWVLRKERTIR